MVVRSSTLHASRNITRREILRSTTGKKIVVSSLDDHFDWTPLGSSSSELLSWSSFDKTLVVTGLSRRRFCRDTMYIIYTIYKIVLNHSSFEFFTFMSWQAGYSSMGSLVRYAYLWNSDSLQYSKYLHVYSIMQISMYDTNTYHNWRESNAHLWKQTSWWRLLWWRNLSGLALSPHRR